MDWNKMVKMTVPVGLCGWQQRGSLTINGRTTEFPVGMETELPEPVAERVKALMADAEEKAEHVQPLKPWMQYVTGADGVARWEPRLAYAETEEVVILPETELIPIEYMPDTYALTKPFAAPLSNGMNCKVTYNGVAFDCTARPVAEGMDILRLGNYGAIAGGEDTGEPFVIIQCLPDQIQESGYYAQVSVLDGAESVTLSITGVVEKVKTIDPKFLPAGAGGGGGFVVHATLTPDSDGGTGTATFDKTFEETLTAVKAGQYVSCQCVLPELEGITQVLPAYSYNGDMISFMIYAGAAVVMVDMMPTEGSYEFITTT